MSHPNDPEVRHVDSGPARVPAGDVGGGGPLATVTAVSWSSSSPGSMTGTATINPPLSRNATMFITAGIMFNITSSEGATLQFAYSGDRTPATIEG